MSETTSKNKLHFNKISVFKHFFGCAMVSKTIIMKNCIVTTDKFLLWSVKDVHFAIILHATAAER